MQVRHARQEGLIDKHKGPTRFVATIGRQDAKGRLCRAWESAKAARVRHDVEVLEDMTDDEADSWKREW